MVLIGIDNGIVALCVHINPDQLQLASEMYPHMILQEQIGDENIGWTFDGKAFTAPQG